MEFPEWVRSIVMPFPCSEGRARERVELLGVEAGVGNCVIYWCWNVLCI